MPFAASINLASLNGADGVRLIGGAAGDRVGTSVAFAGDINGDGIGDIIVGLRSDASERAYVVFGQAGGFSADLDLTALDGTDGFAIAPTGAGTFLGSWVSGIGDVNADGVDDLAIGAAASGRVFILYGRDVSIEGDFAAEVTLATLGAADGTRFSTFANYGIGTSVEGIGDLNGDGIDDFVIGTPAAAYAYTGAGGAYVVFGNAAGFGATFDLSTLNGTNGFRLDGAASNIGAGRRVADAGDINGDGFDDLAVTAWRTDYVSYDSGSTYIIFGKDTAVDGAFAAALSLSAIDGTNGFRIDGEAGDFRSGASVDSVGDINGDGFDDLVIGSIYDSQGGQYAGAAFVVFGRDTGEDGDFPAVFSVEDLDGTNGFKLYGRGPNDVTGWAVSALGDFNDDGFNDMIVGAYRAGTNEPGEAYVVFGGNSFAASIALGDLNGEDGFRLVGVTNFGQAGSSVGGGMDFNGDGTPDLIVGAPLASAPGAQSGAAYIVFGEPPPLVYNGGGGADTYAGTANRDDISGGAGNDILGGGGADDVIDGGDNADLLTGGTGDDSLLGGLGGDTLQGDDGQDLLSGGDGNDKIFGGTGADQINGGTGNDRMDGQADIDTLEGGGGNDYLDGGAGADVMTGGLGNDVYIVDDAGDQTVEVAGEGFDIVRTAVGGLSLADEVEGLELQGVADIDATGNAGANNLQGNSGANTLTGLEGNDTMNGNDGDDIIIGGLGGDLLRGGSGADIFRVAHVFGALETDQIFDFATADGDTLDLGGVDANTLVGGDQDFTIVAAFTRVAGQMTVTFSGGLTTVRLDVNGDARFDYQVRINGDVTGDTGGWDL